jgi:membrane associated rhomboid family serine protease
MDLHVERTRIRVSFFFPLLFLFIAYMVKLNEWFFGVSAAELGIEPLKISGLAGIVLSALLHGDFAHLYANTLPLLLLGTALFYYYRDLALRVFILSWLLSGLLTWLFARSGIHIGASGLIYSLAAFHLLSAALRRNKLLIGFAFVVVFLYGSLLWGIFPAFDLKGDISWEGHLMGMLSGIALALLYIRKELPWIEENHPIEDEEEDDDEDDNPEDVGREDHNLKGDPQSPGDPDLLDPQARAYQIHYHYRKKG